MRTEDDELMKLEEFIRELLSDVLGLELAD